MMKQRHDLYCLDYDGTLAPFVKRPEDAVPSDRLINLLKQISADKKNKVVINSGRNHQVLDKWFKKMDLDFAAEHGMFTRRTANGTRTCRKRWCGTMKSLISFSIPSIKRPARAWSKKMPRWYGTIDTWMSGWQSCEHNNW